MANPNHHPGGAVSDPQCNGICVTAWDVGIMECSPDVIAYPHPECELHCPPDDKDDEK